MTENKKALIAMSGGVDSSVAAFLMKSQGYDCLGATMKLYENETIGITKQKTCCSLSDVEDAKEVCYRLKIPHYTFNYKNQFENTVIKNFVASYQAGETPNPCLDCNRYLKFDLLIHRAKQLFCDYVVTGHYAIIEKAGNRFLLKKGLDETKDQSYVLYFLTQKQLSNIQFPLGRYRKNEIRKIAQENGFVNAAKKDSQDICFVPDGNYAAFIERYTGKINPCGNFINSSGKVLGRHNGIIRYTVGQRKGLGISAPYPLYVISKNSYENTVTLGETEKLLFSGVIADNINLISVDSIKTPIKAKAKIRYNMAEQPCTVVQTGGNRLKVLFDFPQRAAQVGQAVVLYDGDTVIGGGTIREVIGIEG